MKTIKKSKKYYRKTSKKIGGNYICDTKKTIEGCINDYIENNNFLRIETVDDGNCFFDTLSKFYEMNGINKSHTELRKELIKYMYDNLGDIAAFLSGESDILNSINELSKNGVWSSNLGDSIPSIATKAFKITIIIHDVRKKKGAIPRHIQILQLEPEGERSKYTIHMLRNINHYELLVPAAGINKHNSNTNKNKSSSNSNINSEERMLRKVMALSLANN